MAEPHITDCTCWAKVLVCAHPHSRHVSTRMSVVFGRAARDSDGALVVGAAPARWLLLSPTESADALVARCERLAGDDRASVVDMTHAHTLLRLTGLPSAALLTRLCRLDLGDRACPDGAAFRSLVAKIAVTVVRDDCDDIRSYLLLCDRSYGRYLHDVLRDAATGLHPAADQTAE